MTDDEGIQSFWYIYPTWGAVRCPYGKAGDKLWVRENWRVTHNFDHLAPRELNFERGMTIMYAAGGSRAKNGVGEYENHPTYPETLPTWAGKGRPSIHMPRAACRTLLDVGTVRIERLQDITEEDAIAEGVERKPDLPYWRNYLSSELGSNCIDFTCLSARDSFRTLWDSINEARGYSWESNPWLWVVGFSMD